MYFAHLRRLSLYPPSSHLQRYIHTPFSPQPHPSRLFPTKGRLDDRIYPLRVANSSAQGTNHSFLRNSSRSFPFPFLSLFSRTPFSALGVASNPLPLPKRATYMYVACVREMHMLLGQLPMMQPWNFQQHRIELV